MNQQQGVGKTTTVINLAHALALAGRKVAIIDMDPDGNIATQLGLEKSTSGMDAVLLDKKSLDESIEAARNNLILIQSGDGLLSYETLERGGSAQAYKLKKVIEASSLQHYDFVLIDSPSKFGLLSLNCIFASDDVVMPIASHFESLSGITQLIDIIKRAEKITGFSIKLWLLTIRMNMKRRLASELRQKIIEHFPKRVFNTIILENTDLVESKAMGKTIFEYQVDSQSVMDYTSLALDVMEGRVS
jgi:chromosome partitioning protein